MDLWIRSQDKKDLINVSEYLSIEETNFSEDIEYVKNPNKRPFFIECGNCILGFYATEERALEVLDEIQNILKPKYILNASSIKPNGDCYEKNGEIYQDYSADARIEQLNIYVYEMPEE